MIKTSRTNVLLRHKGRVIQFVFDDSKDVRQTFMYRESTKDITFDVRSLPAAFMGDDEVAIADGNIDAHKRAIERAINRNFDFRLETDTSLHTCHACDWTGTTHQLELIEDAPHRVAVGELMPMGQCPSCGTCIEVSDAHVPEYTLMVCTDILRKQGWIVQKPAEVLRKVA